MTDSLVEDTPAGGGFELPQHGAAEAAAMASPEGGTAIGLDSVLQIPVQVQVVLGSTTMPVASLMELSHGAIVPLDGKVGEPVDIVVNGRVVARGELVVMDEDNSRFGISLTEIVSAQSKNGSAG